MVYYTRDIYDTVACFKKIKFDLTVEEHKNVEDLKNSYFTPHVRIEI